MDRDLAHLTPTFRATLELVLQDLRAQGHDPWVAETLRTEERQRDLVARKLSRTMASRHLTGQAADVVDGRMVGGHLVLWGASDPSWHLMQEQERARKLAAREFFAALGAACARHGLTWGGSWRSFPDPAHVEIP